MTPSTLPRTARCISLLNQTRLPAPPSRHLSTTLALRRADKDPSRACGVPLDATEAGPSSPSGILRPAIWLVGAGATAALTGFYLFAPGSSSPSGQAMQTRILEQRKVVERREGDREEEETEEEKMLEAEIVKRRRVGKM